MTDNETPQSMDDVLASIRRIVRSEREEEPDEDVQESETPLELTPDMDGGASDGASLASFVSAPEHARESYDATVLATADPARPAIGEDRIREIVREVVREELESGGGADLVRDILRAELTTGQTGANISRNVLRLIRSEISKTD